MRKAAKLPRKMPALEEAAGAGRTRSAELAKVTPADPPYVFQDP
jgi:hypothetical protein